MKTIYLVASGDLRSSANQRAEAEQQKMEQSLIAAIAQLGATVQRAHGFRPEVGHSFIDSQKQGMEVFRTIPTDAPLIVAEAVWQCSSHVLPGLMFHKGPILTVANWSGAWPGLLGVLVLNGSLAKAGVKYSTLWSEDFQGDPEFLRKLGKWIKTGKIKHNAHHVKSFKKVKLPAEGRKLGVEVAKTLRKEHAIMGVFDEGCLGMFNAIIPDALLNATGVFKERLSQSTLYYAMTQISDSEAREVLDWYKSHGMNFHFGQSEQEDLTENQVLQQCKMYIAALRLADEFGCSAIGIQYQQGLANLAPASDLVEGTLNNVERPPVKSADGSRELYAGEALPHFNEVDECAGLDGLVTYKIWRTLGYDPENTLHDIRWGRPYTGPGKDADGNDAEIDDFVWVLEISGAAPPKHFVDGWAGAHGYRQPPAFFKLGGATCSGISKPGHVVWSRVYVQEDRLKVDMGIAEAIGLPPEETQDRLNQTTPVWPIMHAVLKGISRDQMMGRHLANHIQVAYAPTLKDARRALAAKAAAMDELGIKVAICGKL